MPFILDVKKLINTSASVLSLQLASYMIQEADKDGHKEVDQEEFVNTMLKIVQLITEILESLFDSTKNHYVSTTNYHRASL